MKVRHSARTDVGRTREHNEDNYGVGVGERVKQLGELLVVCDGMGGHSSGEVASGLSVETILAMYYEDSSEDRAEALRRAFEQANHRVHTQGRGSMGTTGVAALLYRNGLYVANVGDSRAYLVRNGEIQQITRDHSYVSDQVAAGLLTPDQARSSPIKNVITRAIGYQAEVVVDLFYLPLEVNDIILLCSDGLHGQVSDAEIASMVSTTPPEQVVDRLVDLANERGGPDNITVVISYIDELDRITQVLPPPEDEQVIVAQDGQPSPSTNMPELATLLSTPVPASAPVPNRESHPESVPTERIVPPVAPAHPAAVSAATPPAPERRLTQTGCLLSVTLLTGLLVVIIYGASNRLLPLVDRFLPSNVPSATIMPRATYTPALPTMRASPARSPTSRATTVPSRTPSPATSAQPTERPTDGRATPSPLPTR